ncbi:MAG: cyclic nucleotide-binding domain-containing protein [Pseudomonadota bacterium]
MAINSLVQPLRNIALFQGLRPLQITEIARRSERIVYRPGQTLIREDELGDAAILVIAGDAVRVDGPHGADQPEVVPIGALVGELAMLVEIQHSSTVIARGQVRALRITREEMHRQMQEDPAVAEHFLGQLSQRLHNVSDQFKKLDQQLDKSLSHLTIR